MLVSSTIVARFPQSARFNPLVCIGRMVTHYEVPNCEAFCTSHSHSFSIQVYVLEFSSLLPITCVHPLTQATTFHTHIQYLEGLAIEVVEEWWRRSKGM